MPRSISILILLLFMAGSARSQADRRFFWVVRDGLSSPQEVDALLARAQAAGANGVVVQVVGRGEAYYDSEILPHAAFSGFSDPLEYLIQRAGPMGLEVHAWINAYLVWSAPSPPLSETHIYNTHPQWFTAHRNGRSSRSYTGEEAEAAGIVGATLSPAFPGVRKYVADIAREIAVNYRVTGVHLDYIRYPNTSFGYSPGEVELYTLETGLTPNADPAKWSSWRQEQVTSTVESVRAVLRSAAPSVQLSCAVMANPHTAASEFASDWRSWLAWGLVDFVCPMAYTSNTARALELAETITAEYPERVVYGIGVWNQTVSGALIAGQRALELGAGGLCVFSLNSLPEGGEELLRQSWGSHGSPAPAISPAHFHRVVVP